MHKYQNRLFGRKLLFSTDMCWRCITINYHICDLFIAAGQGPPLHTKQKRLQALHNRDIEVHV